MKEEDSPLKVHKAGLLDSDDFSYRMLDLLRAALARNAASAKRRSLNVEDMRWAHQSLPPNCWWAGSGPPMNSSSSNVVDMPV